MNWRAEEQNTNSHRLNIANCSIYVITNTNINSIPATSNIGWQIDKEMILYQKILEN